MLKNVDNVLKGMKFTLFGLGDKQYVDTYNAFGKKVNEVLLERGATHFYEYGQCSASDCPDDAYEEWLNGLWQALLAESGDVSEVNIGKKGKSKDNLSVSIVSKEDA